MSRPADDQPKSGAPRARGGLRLVKDEPVAPQDGDGDGVAAGEAQPPRPKSRLGQFLTAYADAIDRDVKLLLDL